MFLAITKKKVIDTPVQAAVPENLEADPPVGAQAEVAEVSHLEVDQIYIEDAAAQVAANMESDVFAADYYEIKTDPLTLVVTLHSVSLKTGARTKAPAREIAKIESDGAVVGSTVVDV